MLNSWCSGDIGQADRAQYVYHTGRVQEVITTAGGEHLIRTPIQNRIKGCMSIVDEAVISGEKRKALVALITVKVALNCLSSSANQTFIDRDR